MVVVRSVHSSPGEPYPWIGQVRHSTARFVKLAWWKGSYTTTWSLDTSFAKCTFDKVAKKHILAVIKWNPQQCMPKALVEKIRLLYSNDF